MAGPIYRPGEGVEDGWILIDGRRVVDAGQGRPPQTPEARGLVLPALVDAHTHVGDRVGRGTLPPGLSLDALVKPPDGLKHRLLRETPRAALVAGMREARAELRAAGTRAFVDFREGGLDGARMLREAGDAPRAVSMARCAGAWDDAEAEAVLREADGIGLSGLGDVPSDVPERAAAVASRRKKRFALHLSEARREDVPRALALRPDFLVHVCAYEHDDLARIAAARVPVVLCPRSNARFGRAPDAPAMLDAGIALALGSDNAMFHRLDVLEDARLLARLYPAVPVHAWLDAAIAGGARVVDGAVPRAWLRKGDDAGLLVVEADDVEALFAPHRPRTLCALV
ncbi:MAG TPA: amidohydrolase family protein [Candidatus Thermoplasmatota archaeon]|nr:amidohydrolase family protein [Candidatus Thermoplasmatota archaeon]